MKATISPQIRQQLNDYCISQLPKEACGLLMGSTAITNSEYNWTITGWAPITNAAADPYRYFEFDPVEWVHAMIQAEQKRSSAIIGVFHSHPTSAAIPSSEDLSAAYPSNWAHIILSLVQPENPDCRIYIYQSREYLEITLQQR
jgi:[CysO sulfur-carrier protein]-S-L-cysteine hydrolase